MKALIKKTVYAGVGLVGDGAEAAKKLGRKLARKADASEVSGEKIVRKFQARSSKAVKSIRKTLDAEVTKVADAVHAALREDVELKRPKPASVVKTSSKQLATVKPARTRGKAD